MPQAIRDAEQAMLPEMINLDAFYVSHAMEPVDVPAQEDVDAYLPPFAPAQRLDTAVGSSWGNVVSQDMFYRHRQALQEAMERVPRLLAQADGEWQQRFGRGWGVVERYRCDGARTVIVTMGSMAGTAREAVDAMRDAGEPVGLVRLRLFRPFPAAALRAALDEGRLARGYVRREPSAAADYLRSVGLTGPFWE